MASCGVGLTWFDCKDIGMNSSVYGKANNKFAIEYGQEMNSGRNTTSILVLLKEGLIIIITKFSNLIGYQLPWFQS